MKIVLIGAGNVATHLGIAFKNIGCQIVQVYSRTQASAESLAATLGSEAVSDIKQLSQNADLYVIAVSDSAVSEIAANIHLPGKTVVHTAGSLPMNILSEVSDNYGVIYIPQTFVKNIPISYKDLQFCIETSNKETEKNIHELLAQISTHILHINSRQREALHLAAVMVSNFTNCLYGIADDILSKENLSLEVLQPLIIETAKKPEHGNPKDLQTGPAKRGDENIIQKHLEMLKNDTPAETLYRLFTKIIQENNSAS
ncbi:DUF2520 domain-containing protein [Bacteroidales bacterium OttesenSCG-928-C19]|nr:DUF2520 domain-containing protein [Bacteroidales bacterium OttesenSCG-928-C19]